MLRGRRRFVVLTLSALLAPPAAAHAGPAAVTLSACKRDSVAVAGKVKLTGSAARKARDATLQLRFQALPLFGLPRAGHWRTAGRRTSGSGSQAFTGLGADNWVGAMTWRFVKGRRTVASGIERSQPVRVGRARGRASCTIAEGLKPPDARPPALFILPADGLWHRAPADVQLTAADDFSGVRSVSYSLDGGPMTRIPNGSKFTIGTEGVHSVRWEATDVAGNTATRTESVRVDAAPPSKPALAKPPAVTQSTTPTFQWAPATDTGSGIGGYAVTVRKGDGSLAMPKLVVDANTTSVPSPVALNDGETYTAVLTAFDNSAGGAWTTDSDTLTFRVDNQANIASVSPAPGSILSGGAKDSNFTIALDRAANPATVSTTTVVLDRSAESGSDPSYTAGCANTPCTVIAVDPSGTLGEGRYTLSVNGVKSAGEGLTFQRFSAAYSVAFLENGAGVDPGGTVCIGNATSTTSAIVTAAGGETGVLDFNWSYAAGPGWSVSASTGGTPVSGGPGSGDVRLTFPIPSGTNTITFTFTSNCSGGNSTKLDTSNLVGARLP